MNADATVWTTRRFRGHDRLCVHSDRDCDRLSNASKVYEHELDELDAYRYCSWCSGSVDVDHGDNYSLHRLLDNSDPEVFGLSPMGERQKGEASD